MYKIFAAISLSFFALSHVLADESHIADMMSAAKERDCETVYEIGMPWAERGDTEAQLIMGRCKLGLGDGGEGHDWLDRALDGGEGRAAAYLAIHHSSLAGGEPNEDMVKACRYSERGAALGDRLSKNYVMAFKCKELLAQKESSAWVGSSNYVDKNENVVVQKSEATTPSQEVILTYLGKPIRFNEKVEAFCRDRSSGGIAPCHFRQEADGRYMIDLLPPGRYALRVSVDENRENPSEGPGDYYRYYQFKVDRDINGPLRVSMQKFIHMIQPADNNRAVEGNSSDCPNKPHFVVPPLSLGSNADITFAWNRLEPDVTYHYTLWKANCSGGGMIRLVYKQTTQMQATESLPPSVEGEFYLFRITAVKDGEMMGNLTLRDNGGTGMQHYRFRVRDSIPHRSLIIKGGMLGCVGVLIVLLLWLRKRRRPSEAIQGAVVEERNGQGATITILLAALVLPAGGYYLVTVFADPLDTILSKVVEQITKEETSREFRIEEDKGRSAREDRRHHLRAEFEMVVPLPYWWSEIKEPEYIFNSLSDVMAIKPDSDRTPKGSSERKKIIKQCYLAIIENTHDDDLVTSCLSMIAYLEQDRDLIIKVTDFAVRFYFNYPHSGEGCAGCMPADTMASIILNGSRAHSYRDNYDEAEALLKRFIEKRAQETSDWKIEQVYAQLGVVYWHQGMKEEAISLLQSTYDNYREELERTTSRQFLEAYKKELQR